MHAVTIIGQPTIPGGIFDGGETADRYHCMAKELEPGVSAEAKVVEFRMPLAIWTWA